MAGERGAADPVEKVGKAAPGGAPRGRRTVVAALMLGMALAALDVTVVSTAVPQIVGDLGGFSAFSWVFSGYLLAVTVTLPVYGKLADTIGRKPVLVIGIGVFLVGSLLCATAWNMTSLIAFRIIQGLGGGALQGTVQTIAADLYPAEQRPKIQARLSSVWAGSAVTGPAIGGAVAEYADWRWIFLLNLPVGAVALWLIVRHLHEPRREKVPATVDWPGALALFGSGALLITALVQGGVAWPWLSTPSLALFAGGAAMVAVTVVVERRATDPIIPGWVWRRRTIAAVNLSFGALGVLMIAPNVFIPTYGQSVLGLDPTRAGFVLTVMLLSWPVSAALSGKVYQRIGFRLTAAIGAALTSLVLGSFFFLPHPGEPWHPALIMLLLGGALGLFQLPLLIGVQSSVLHSERGTATASVFFCRQIGQTVGAALFGALANAVLASRLGAGDADSVGRAVNDPSALPPDAADRLRRAVDAAVEYVFLGAAAAAAAALLVLLFVASRGFPEPSDEAGEAPKTPFSKI
ncbi:MFS transporter [Streptomyces sp. NPDC048057]|uniref:MFS transporter n=1 Tax=Streptomyces sp. NPDC048057 TaxID=3155628 RepID=UPI0033DA2535